MRKYTLGLIFSICLVDSVYAGFYQFGGSSNIGTGTAGQVLLTGSTGTTQWGENEILSSWYLPSIAEFAEMYAQKDIIGSFSGYYWTSNEISANNAIYKLMDDGSTGQQSKLFTCGVRAIRSFDTTYFAGKYLIGDTLGNGKVFYIDATGKKGLICSLVDQSNAAWGSQIIVATNDGIYAGKNNSINIIDVNGTISTAAKICRDYAPSSSSGGSGSGGGAPTDATYITQVSHGSLTAGQALGSLSTGIMKNTTGTGIVSVAIAGTDFVAPNIAVVDATKTKISYDTKGLVTAGADATTADIADSVDKRYCTDVQKTVIGNTSGINTGDQNLSGKQDFIATGTTGQYYRGDKTFQTLDNAAVGLGNVTNNAQYYAGGADVAIADGGTGQSSAQLAINTLTNVEAAMNEQVLTKDTTSGNVIFKDASGGVSSFNTRTGAVVPATNDYTWAQVNKATSNIADIATKSHTSLTDIGNNNHAAIDTFVSSKAAASGLASLDADSKVVQDPVNAVVTPAAGKIPIADGSGKLNGWVTATIPAGVTGQIQFNDNSAFAGHKGLSYNPTTAKLTVGYISAGEGYTGDLQNNGGGDWVKSRQLTVTALADALPAGYSVKVVLTDAAANSVFADGQNAVRIATNIATAATTLDGAIDDVQTIITLTNTAALPDVGMVIVENERIGYSSKNTTQLLGCVRGSGGTTPAAHATGLAVTTVQELERYIETFSATNVTIWFKLRRNILANENSIDYKLYYGNASAGAAPSNGKNVFDFFDDFDGTTLNTSDWTISNPAAGTVVVANGEITISSDNDIWGINDTALFITSQREFTGNYVADAYQTGNTYDIWQRIFLLRNSANTNSRMIGIMNTDETLMVWRTIDEASAELSGGVPMIALPNTLKFIRNGDIVTGYTGNNVILSRTIEGLSRISLADTHGQTNNNKFAWVRVRMWVAADTVAIDGNFAAVGAEQVSGAIIGGIRTLGTPIYADNDTAIANGLIVGDNYRTPTGVKMEVY